MARRELIHTHTPAEAVPPPPPPFPVLFLSRFADRLRRKIRYRLRYGEDGRRKRDFFAHTWSSGDEVRVWPCSALLSSRLRCNGQRGRAVWSVWSVCMMRKVGVEKKNREERLPLSTGAPAQEDQEKLGDSSAEEGKPTATPPSQIDARRGGREGMKRAPVGNGKRVDFPASQISMLSFSFPLLPPLPNSSQSPAPSVSLRRFTQSRPAG